MVCEDEGWRGGISGLSCGIAFIRTMPYKAEYQCMGSTLEHILHLSIKLNFQVQRLPKVDTFAGASGSHRPCCFVALYIKS